MNVEHIVRAWKDVEYRESLSATELTDLPENPAGLLELTDSELQRVVGGIGSRTMGETPFAEVFRPCQSGRGYAHWK